MPHNANRFIFEIYCEEAGRWLNIACLMVISKTSKISMFIIMDQDVYQNFDVYHYGSRFVLMAKHLNF